MAKDKIVEFGDGRMMEYQVGRRSELVGVWRLPVDAETKLSDLVAYNMMAEQAGMRILLAMFDRYPDGVPVGMARAEIAYRVGVSVETVKRYLAKWCAPSAPFEIVGGRIKRKDERKEGKDGK